MANKATVSVGLDINGLMKSLNEAVRALQKLAGQSPHVKVNVDSSEVDKAENKVDELSSTQTVKIDVDTAGLNQQVKQAGGSFDALKAGIGGAIGGFALNAVSSLATGLKEGALRADEFGDALGVAFTQQGIADVDAEIKKVNDSAVQLANSLGLPAARTKELAVNVATLGGVSGQQAQDLTKLSAGLEVFTNGAVKGEAVVKAFSRGIADPEGAAAIENLTKKYPQLAEVLKSNLSPAEKLAKANLALGNSFAEVEAQQSDAGGSLNKISNQLNEAFEKIGTQVLEALAPLANALGPITEGLIGAFTTLGPILKSVVDNFDVIGPVVLTAAAAFGAYQLAISASAIATKIVTAATAAWNAILALNPIGLVVAGVVAATAGIIALADAMNISAEENLEAAESEKKLIEQQIKSNQERTKTVQSSKSLVAEYEKLANKSNLTAQEQARLRTIQSDLNKQYPKLIDNTKGFKDNLDGVKQIGQAVNGELDKLGKQANDLAERLVKSTQRIAKASAEVALEALTDETTGPWYTFGAAITDTQKRLKNAGQTFAAGLRTAKTVEQVDALRFAFEETIEKIQGLDPEEASTYYEKAGIAAGKYRAYLESLTKQQEKSTEATKGAPPPPPPPDADKAKQYADALAKARAELQGLNDQLEKNQRIAEADTIDNLRKREIAKLDIEKAAAQKSLDEELANIKSKDELGNVQREINNKKRLLIEQKYLQDLGAINGKYNTEELKQQQEQQRKLEEINNKFIADQLSKLKQRFQAGDNTLASQVIDLQRKVIEGSLSDGIDTIIAQTPEYQKAINALNKELAAGLDPIEYQNRARDIRAGILVGLQGESADTKNIFALQIRAAYTSAGDEIAKGTAEIVSQIRQQQVKQAGDIFADSLRGIGEALRSVDFATIYGDAATQAASLNEEQDKLIQSLKDGETTYQDAVGELQNLSSQQEQTASATAQAIAASFQAIADQQAKAAEDGINQRNQNLERIRQIGDEEIQLAKDKAAALKAIEDQQFADEQARQAARDSINSEFAQKEKKLTNERDQLAKQSEETQAAALENLAVSAGAAFTALVAGGENAGEALKKVVGQTVAALLDLYTPSIVALFSSIIPPPFGQIAGLAAVQGLKALLQSALNGFEEGGYTGNVGTKQVAGVVHGQEFVMTAETTRKNRALLEHIHAGKPLESFPALQKMLADNQIQSIPVTELQMMRSELSAIRQRLDSMPNGIQGQMGVDVNVGMDTYLYEKDRSRMIARKLRG